MLCVFSVYLFAKLFEHPSYFNLLYPVGFKKFLSHIVKPVVTWVQSFKKSRREQTLMEM